MEKVFSNALISCTVHMNDDGTVHIRGNVKSPAQYVSMFLLAAHPIDRRVSYSGSGLPWPCPSQAFQDTPNRYEIPESGHIDCTFMFPNSYYLEDAFERVSPSIFLICSRPNNSEPQVVRMELPEDATLKLRTLTHRPRRHVEGPLFYNTSAYIEDIPTSAEAVMRTLKDYRSMYDIAP